MIQAKSIHKSYDSLHVLKGVDLTVNKGEIVSIVGASGAGKTTLLQILGTLDTPSLDKPSSLLINNIDVNQLNEKDLAKFRNEHLGFVFQFHQLLPEFSAIENVCLPAFIKGGAEQEAIEKATKLLDFLGLSERCYHKPSELSGGEQQRVAVARAFVNEPALLFADEPTGNLDRKTGESITELLFKLNRETGTTLILVTHDERLADQCRRILHLEDGQLNEVAG